MKTIDLKQKIECRAVGNFKDNFTKAANQDFYFSPSKKMIHLAEKLPNGDYWIVKSFRTDNVIVLV